MSADSSPQWNVEVLRLAEAIVNDEATVGQIERLDELLASDAAARALYLDYVDVHAGLRRKYLAPALEDTAESESTGEVVRPQRDAAPTTGRLPTAFLSAFLALAACLTIYVFVPGSSTERAEGTVQAESHAASVNGVAVLSRTVGVEWSDGSKEYSEGAPIPCGVLSIESGLVQVDFYCGAIAVLEGPARLELHSADRAALIKGKLRARVPTRARGFTIGTDHGDIVDLGTEFAVEAPSAGEPGELHVIDGEVRFHPNDKPQKTPVSLRGGEAVWLGRGGKSAPIDAAGRFVGPTEVESLVRQASDEKLADWLAHRRKLLEDPELIALYGYSPEPEWGRLLRNLAPGSGDDTHGSVIGCEWVEGRWPDHKALRFSNASHRVSVSLPGEFDSLSLATWVAIDRLHPTNRVALMHPEVNQDRVLYWTLDRVPTGALLHFAESEVPVERKSRRHYSSVAIGVFEEKLGNWMHLAVVYDADLKRLTHYSDGKVVGWQPITEPSKLSIGVADIGNWPYKDWAKGTEFEMRNLMGRMDEFVAVGRALSGREIEEMYEAGRP